MSLSSHIKLPWNELQQSVSWHYLWDVPEQVCKPDHLGAGELHGVPAGDQDLALDGRQPDGDADVDGDPVEAAHTPGGINSVTEFLVKVARPELKQCVWLIERIFVAFLHGDIT